jgi:hypothetical protein
MTPLGKSILAAIGSAVLLAFACHGLGLNAHGFALIPLLGGGAVGLYVNRKESER